VSYAGGPRKIEDAEVEAFSVKLEQWVQELQPAEQALARVMLARARRAREIDIEGFTHEGKEPWDELISGVFRSLVRPEPDYEFNTDVGAFFAKEAGPSWNKGAWVETEVFSEAERLVNDPAPSGDSATERDDAASAVSVFAEHVNDYANTLSPRECKVLQLLLLRAMDPVERIRWTSAPHLLDEGQEALLQELAKRKPAG
jgi:hypothetical protein